MTVPSDIILTPTSIERTDGKVKYVSYVSKRHKGPNIDVFEEQGGRDSQEDAFAYGLIDKTLLNGLSREEKMQRFWTLTKHLHETTEKLLPKTKAGSTASIVIFDGTYLYVISLGDSTVFATAKNNPITVKRLNSNLHKPHYSKEAKYINKKKGIVSDERSYRIHNGLNGYLNLSRSFGDLSFVNKGLNTSPTIDCFTLATLREKTDSGSNSDIHIISACDGLTEKVEATSQTNTAEKEAQEDFVLTYLEYLKRIHQEPNTSIAKGLAQAIPKPLFNSDNLSIAVHTLNEKTPPFYMAIFDGHGLRVRGEPPTGHEVSSQAARWLGIRLREYLSLTNDQYLQDKFCTQNHQAEFDADHNPDNEDKPENNDYQRLCPLKNFIEETPFPEEKAITTMEESKSVDQPIVAEVPLKLVKIVSLLVDISWQKKQMQSKFSNYSESTYLDDDYLRTMNKKPLKQIRELLHLIIYNLDEGADLSFIQNENLMMEFTTNIYSIQRLVIDLGITFQQLVEFGPEKRSELYNQQLALLYLVKDKIIPKGQLKQFLENTAEIRKGIYDNARALAAFAENSARGTFISYPTFFEHHEAGYRQEYYQHVHAIVQIIKETELVDEPKEQPTDATQSIAEQKAEEPVSNETTTQQNTEENTLASASQAEPIDKPEQQPTDATQPVAEQKTEEAPSGEIILQYNTKSTPVSASQADSKNEHEQQPAEPEPTQEQAEQQTEKPSSDETIAQQNTEESTLVSTLQADSKNEHEQQLAEPEPIQEQVEQPAETPIKPEPFEVENLVLQTELVDKPEEQPADATQSIAEQKTEEAPSDEIIAQRDTEVSAPQADSKNEHEQQPAEPEPIQEQVEQPAETPIKPEPFEVENLAPQTELVDKPEEQPTDATQSIAEQKTEEAPSDEIIAEYNTESTPVSTSQANSKNEHKQQPTDATQPVTEQKTEKTSSDETIAQQYVEQPTDATQPVAKQKTEKPSSDEIIAQFKKTIEDQKVSDKAKQKLTKLADTLNSSYKQYAEALQKRNRIYADELDPAHAEFNAAQQALKDYIYSSQATWGTKVVNAGKVLLTFFKELGYYMLLAALVSVPFAIIGILGALIIATHEVSSIALAIAAPTIVLTLLGGMIGSIASGDAAYKKYGDLKCSFFTSRIGKNSGESQAIENLLTDIDKLRMPAS